MELTELRKHIEKIIKDTFDLIDDVYQNNRESKSIADYSKANSHLIFPKYSEDISDETNKGNLGNKLSQEDDKTRVSEQELRFLFVEKFNELCESEGLYYSIETPTKKKYVFGKGNKDIPKIDKINGKSASIDLTIHNEKGERVALIEFKKDGCSAHDIAKDFLKLSVEEEENDNILRYFVMISDSKTHLTEKEKGNKPLWDAFVDKFKEGNTCFIFMEKTKYHPITIEWHRLPVIEGKKTYFEATYDPNNHFPRKPQLAATK